MDFLVVFWMEMVGMGESATISSTATASPTPSGEIIVQRYRPASSGRTVRRIPSSSGITGVDLASHQKMVGSEAVVLQDSTASSPTLAAAESQWIFSRFLASASFSLSEVSYLPGFLMLDLLEV